MKNSLKITGSIRLKKKSPKANTVTVVNFPKTPKFNYLLFKDRHHVPPTELNFRTSVVSLEEVNLPKPLPATPPLPQIEPEVLIEELIVATSPAEAIPDYRINVPNYSDHDLERINREVFGNSTFKDNQLTIIKSVLSNQHVMVCLPTGNGKSLIYQISGYILEGITLVIMPLISLINDQYEKLSALRVPCIYFNETSSPAEVGQLCHKIVIDRSIKFVFLTPERLLNSFNIQKLLKELHAADRLKLLVIDEFHCITHYSQEFRPTYQNIGQVIKDYPDIRVLCLSGSIQNCELQKIQNNLGITQPVLFKDSPTRKNLYYEIIHKKKDGYGQLISLINSKYSGQTGIVFCNKRKKCEDLCYAMSAAGISCQFFHSQIENAHKEQKRKNWQEGSVKVMVATNAFGMGIDNQMVRFIIHSDLPKSLTDYCQETGRAGRDGLRSDCYLLYSISDRRVPISFLHNTYNESNVSGFHDLYRIIAFCEEEDVCRKVQLAKYFESELSESCSTMCDNCLRKQDRVHYYLNDFTEEAKTILKVVRFRARWTFKKVVSVLVGQVVTNDRSLRELEEFGRLRDLNCVSRILNQMLLNGVVEEYIQPNITGNFHTYLREVQTQVSAEQLKVFLSCERIALHSVDQVTVIDREREIIEILDSPNESESDNDVEFIEVENLPHKRQRKQ